jgi:Ca2+-binding EF-hand superfamily protein
MLSSSTLLSSGCRRNQPTTVTITPAKAATSAPDNVPMPPSPPEITVETSETVSSGAEEPSAQSLTGEPPTYGTERIILFVPGSPLIIELQLNIDGQPHTEALEQLVDEVLKLADADGDGRTTWKEICACKRIKYGQFGNLAIDNDNSEKQIIDRYDIARDGIADRSELPRFLTRNAGASRPFSIRGTLDHRDLNRRGSATWRVIDADDNGVISADEMKAAPGRLAAHDTDDDEILLVSDLSPRLAIPDPEMMNERRRRGPEAARLLGAHADWPSVQRLLEQEYGGARGLKPDSFPLTPELFGQLDKNKDGRVRRDEFEALNSVPPHLVVAAAFGKSEETGDRVQETEEFDESERPTRRNLATLKLVHIDPRLAGESPAVSEQLGRLTVAISGSLLTFYTNDTVASEDFAARAKQVLEMFDQNKDGYLEKNEVPETLQGQLGRFEAVDADEDGKAYPQEIEEFLAQQQAGLRAQIHAKAADSEDVLFAALDADHDDRLDSRELEGAPGRLKTLDQNGDRQITADELPELLLVGLARGSLENADATFAVPPAIIKAADDKGPRWFTAMDANQDGAISRREFVGPIEKFRELDRDSNGLLELWEVAKEAK